MHKTDHYGSDVYNSTYWNTDALPHGRQDAPTNVHNVAPAKALMQWGDEGTEKVHVLEPEVYQNRANSNSPNKRTTFYGQGE